MSDVRVLRAGAEHAGVVGALLFDFNREFGTDAPTADDLSARFADLLPRNDVLVLVAGDPNGPTGFAFLTFRPTPYWDGPLAQLEELYVRPERRGTGMGSALMVRASQASRERGAQEMHINVVEVDTDTRRFYERLGFFNVEPGTQHRMLCYVGDLGLPR